MKAMSRCAAGRDTAVRMASENVERIYAAHDAFNRGELETVAEYFQPDAVWIPYLMGLEAREYRGRDELLDMWRALRQNFVDFRIEPQEVIDGGDRVVLMVEAEGSGAGSGAVVRQRWAQVFTMRDGLIARVKPFATKAEAMTAARLP